MEDDRLYLIHIRDVYRSYRTVYGWRGSKLQGFHAYSGQPSFVICKPWPNPVNTFLTT